MITNHSTLQELFDAAGLSADTLVQADEHFSVADLFSDIEREITPCDFNALIDKAKSTPVGESYSARSSESAESDQYALWLKQCVMNLMDGDSDADSLRRHCRQAEYVQHSTYTRFFQNDIILGSLSISELKEEVSLGSEHQLSRSDSAAMRIIKYINENYREHITLDVLSRLFFASKPTIINQFNAITNSSPINYLLQVRINHAKQMLSNTNKTISEISDACGFSSPNYFSLIFKKKMHMSPSDYRNCYPKA